MKRFFLYGQLKNKSTWDTGSGIFTNICLEHSESDSHICWDILGKYWLFGGLQNIVFEENSYSLESQKLKIKGQLKFLNTQFKKSCL